MPLRLILLCEADGYAYRLAGAATDMTRSEWTARPLRLMLLERNSVWRTFTSPYMRELLREGWEEHARRQLARFRAGYGRFVGDPWWTERIQELIKISPEFRQWWPERDVLYSPEGKKLIYHPVAGKLAFENVSFQASESPDLQIKVSTPLADYDTASKIRRIIAEHDAAAERATR